MEESSVQVDASAGHSPDQAERRDDNKDLTHYAVFVEPDDAFLLALKRLVDVLLPFSPSVETRLIGIKDLAVENDSSSFIPHVTLWEGSLPSDFDEALLKESVGAALVELCDYYPHDQLSFSIKSVDRVGDSLKVAFDEDPPLLFIEHLLKFNIEHRGCFEPDWQPHLSLAHQLHSDGRSYRATDFKGKTEMAAVLEELDGFVGRWMWIARARPHEAKRVWDIVARFKL